MILRLGRRRQRFSTGEAFPLGAGFECVARQRPGVVGVLFVGLRCQKEGEKLLVAMGFFVLMKLVVDDLGSADYTCVLLLWARDRLLLDQPVRVGLQRAAL